MPNKGMVFLPKSFSEEDIQEFVNPRLDKTVNRYHPSSSM
jgi:hypothetical protein